MNEAKRKRQTITGIKWSVLNQIVVQSSTLLIGILMTRILDPGAFGLIAMISVFIGLLNVFNNFGTGAALIYKSEITTADTSTAFWAQVFLGFLLTGIILISSGLIARFFSEPMLKPLTITLSFTFIIESFSYVHQTILKKEINFKKLFWVNSISVVISGAVAIVLAFKGFGVWSIVYKLLLLSILRSSLLWIFSGWRPKFIFSKNSMREQLNYGLPLVGNRAIGYIMRQSDNLLIGKFIGSEALGFYNRAYSLMMLPINQIGTILSNVLFPSFSLAKKNIPIIRSNWLKIIRLTSFVIFPVSFLVFLLAEPFVMIILGEQWSPAIPIIQLFAFAGLVQPISNVSFLFNALGKTKQNFAINMVINSLLIVAIIIGLKNGIRGVALTYTIASILFVPIPKWFFAARLLKTSIIEVFKSIKMIVLANILSFLAVLLLLQLLEMSLLTQLIIVPIIFALTYFAFLYLLKEKVYKELFVLIRP